MNDIIKYSLFESNKYKKYNDILKNLGVMDEEGKIDLKDMTEKINQFLATDSNKDKFLNKYEELNPNVKIKNKKFKASELKPSQTEIFFDHIMSRMVVNDKEREQILNGKLKDDDILVSSDGHVIDGHHRWALAFVLNPNCTIKCTQIGIPVKYALPIINAMIEATEKEIDDVMVDYSINIYDIGNWKKNKLYEKMNTVIEKAIKKGVDLGGEIKKSKTSWKTNEGFSDINTDVSRLFYENLEKKLNLDRHPLKYMRKNINTLRRPKRIFTSRKEMPQIKKDEVVELL